jgi:ZIP family zinc transporter
MVLLGAVAGLTIFVGLPVALIRGIDNKKRGFLNALSIGILVFIVVEVLHSSWESVSNSILDIIKGSQTYYETVTLSLAMFGGLAIGLLGLSRYENIYMNKFQEMHIPSFKIATMIALGIGAHNFSEGLAIGQSYASGALSLALVLVIGFGIHNATEGFGIVAPLTGEKQRPPVGFLAKVGIIGGGPTFLGTIVGSIFFSQLTYVLFLSLAGGALIYVIMIMYSAGKRQTTNEVLMFGILIGLILGFLTDLSVSAFGI